MRIPRLMRPIALFLLVDWLGHVGMARTEADLLRPEELQLLRDELSGELAKDHVIEITRHHRIQGSRGYSDAARYVLQSLRAFGFGESEAWIESFPSDGKVRYQTWQSPSGWSIDSAELRIVSPYRELLVRYPETAMSVITYSNSGRVRAELVDVGAGVSAADYAGKDVKGKIALATGYGGDVHRLAVLEYGAAAVVCYLDDERAALHPDMLRYTGMWPRTEELDRVSFGFNISNRQGRKLKEMLSRGRRVVLDARVEGTGLEPGRMDVVVARIAGTGAESSQLLYSAHLDHPKESANDNASGSAALLDMARTFRKLIREGKLPQPRMTLCFLWVPEFFGTMAYIDAHPEVRGPSRGGRVLANLNLDMVGENLELLHSRLNITWTPPTISSVLTDVVAAAALQVDRLENSLSRGNESNFNYRIVPFSGGSDHVVFNDGAVAVPAMMLNHWPDYAHHTTQDTPDKVDPVELERSELIAASALWHLASLTEEESLSLVNLAAAKAQSRILDDTSRAVSRLLTAAEGSIESAYQNAKLIVDFALRRERDVLESALHFAAFESTRRLVDTWRQTLEGQTELQRRTLLAVFKQRSGKFPAPRLLSAAEQAASLKTPVRLTRGPLAAGLPQRLLPETDRSWHSTPEAQSVDGYLLVNLIDGQRSILQIRDDLTAVSQPVRVETVDRYIRDLEKAGLIELR